MVDLLEGRQGAPGLELGDIFDLSVCLQHHQVVLGHNEVYVDHVLANFACLFALLSQLKFHFLLAGEDAALCVAQPDQHVVV